MPIAHLGVSLYPGGQMLAAAIISGEANPGASRFETEEDPTVRRHVGKVARGHGHAHEAHFSPGAQQDFIPFIQGLDPRLGSLVVFVSCKE